MPVYEYKCSWCGSTVELQRSFDNRDDWPTCAMEHKPRQMPRVISKPSVHFKGQGWGKDD